MGNPRAALEKGGSMSRISTGRQQRHWAEMEVMLLGSDHTGWHKSRWQTALVRILVNQLMPGKSSPGGEKKKKKRKKQLKAMEKCWVVKVKKKKIHLLLEKIQ